MPVNGERGAGPDPSIATTQNILREITMLEEKLGSRIDGTKTAIDTRLEAMDKAIAVLAQFPTEVDKAVGALRELLEARICAWGKVIDRHQVEIDKVPAMRNEAVEHLGRLVDEKFLGIATQFGERDTREDAAKREAKEAIAAALQAQKEAVGKTETGFEKRIDQIGQLITTSNKALDEKVTSTSESLAQRIAAAQSAADRQVSDLKDRFIPIDGRLTSIESQKKGSDDNWKAILGVVGAVIGAGGFVLAILAFSQ